MINIIGNLIGFLYFYIYFELLYYAIDELYYLFKTSKWIILFWKIGNNA